MQESKKIDLEEEEVVEEKQHEKLLFDKILNSFSLSLTFFVFCAENHWNKKLTK